MNIGLPHALQRYVDDQIESGRYLDACDVVRSALRRAQVQDALSDLPFGNGDLMSLVQLVMMQCAKANADVLGDIMDELRRSREKECRGNARVDDLRIQLADIDLAIKRLLQELESKRLKEMDERGRIDDEKEQTTKLVRDLDKAAQAYSDLLQTISSMFAR